MPLTTTPLATVFQRSLGERRFILLLVCAIPASRALCTKPAGVLRQQGGCQQGGCQQGGRQSDSWRERAAADGTVAYGTVSDQFEVSPVSKPSAKSETAVASRSV